MPALMISTAAISDARSRATSIGLAALLRAPISNARVRVSRSLFQFALSAGTAFNSPPPTQGLAS